MTARASSSPRVAGGEGLATADRWRYVRIAIWAISDGVTVLKNFWASALERARRWSGEMRLRAIRNSRGAAAMWARACQVVSVTVTLISGFLMLARRFISFFLPI